MKIYVEGSSVFKSRSGVGSYAKRLVEHYIKQYPEDEVTFFGFKFFTRPLPDWPIPPAQNLKYKIIRWLPGRVYNMLFRMRLGLPLDLFLGWRPDVVIFPNFIRWPVWNPRVKTLVVIHDLSFVHFPQFASPINLSDNQRFVPKSIKKASRVITISESSKQQIIDHYKVPASKISIAGPAVDPEFFYKRSSGEIKKMRAKYKLPAKYILYHGTIEPRKNIEGLLEIYAQLPQNVQDEYGLVLAGGKGWQDEGIVAAIAHYKKAGLNIVQTGYLPDEDAPGVISGASLLVFPSFYEGFGMPPLEAMACGVPVISSDNSSLPEIVGDAGIMLKAEDKPAWVAAITKVLDDKDLKARMVAAGHQQVKKFTWQRSAEALKRVLEK